MEGCSTTDHFDTIEGKSEKKSKRKVISRKGSSIRLSLLKDADHAEKIANEYPMEKQRKGYYMYGLTSVDFINGAMWVPALLIIAASDSTCVGVAIEAVNGLSCSAEADWDNDLFIQYNGTSCMEEKDSGFGTETVYEENDLPGCIDAFFQYRNATGFTCNCTGDHAYLGGEGGIRPLIVIVALETATRLLLGIAGPLYGHIIDTRPYRKEMMKMTFIFLIVATLGMCVLGSGYLWLVAYVSFALSTLFDKLTEDVLQSYLPYVSQSEQEHAKLGSYFQIVSFTTQVGFLVILLALFIFLDTVVAASVGCALTAIALVCAGTVFIPAMPPLPGRPNASKSVNIFKEIWREMTAMPHESPEAFKYLLCACFSILGVQNVITLSTTFFVAHVGMNSFQNGISFICALAAGAGTMAFVIKFDFMRKFRLKRLYTYLVVVFLLILVTTVLFLRRGTFVEAYIATGCVGATLSLYYAIEWPLFCLLIPLGKEATYRGIYSFVRNIVGFLGPGIYTLVVQETNNHVLAFSQVILWNVLLIVALQFVDVDKALRENGIGSGVTTPALPPKASTVVPTEAATVKC
eukprot:g1332.t1